MQAFSEESLLSLTDSTQTFEDFEEEEKKINLTSTVWKCFMSPLTPSKPFIVS